VPDDFFSFDEALDELRLKEEELKRLVSEGEIRAFRKGDTMKLRRADVENLRAELSGGEVVDLGEATEELVFEDDTDLDDDAGMATQEIADVETIIEEVVEDVGELDLEMEEEAPQARSVRRQSAIAAAAEEEEAESMATRALLIGTAMVLLLVMPMAMSIGSGNISDLARSIAGMIPF
jgi:hypothetical protein